MANLFETKESGGESRFLLSKVKSSHVETLLLGSSGLWSFTQETCPGIAAVKLLTQTHMTNLENTG